MKKILIALAALLLLCSCKANENNTGGSGGTFDARSEVINDIAGDYYAFSCQNEEGVELELNNEILHLLSDGSGTFEIEGELYSLNYELHDHEFTFTDEEGDVFNGSYYNGMIAGTYFNNYYYTFTDDYDLYLSLSGLNQNPSSGDLAVETADSISVYYTLQTLYEQQYGIRTAVALVPYGWSASVKVTWVLWSSMYPALATVTMVSPDGNAIIEIQSTFGYLQMARNGQWVPEGTYLDLYNVYLNYHNAHDYNDYLLGLYGYTGSIVGKQGPSYEFQLDLNANANTLLQGLSSVSGVQGVQCEGTYEKTSYFITEGNAYEVEICSAVIMAETLNGAFDNYSWHVPFAASFIAYNEEAYSNYFKAFDNVVSNTNFTQEFIYVVQRNAQYINEMIHNYLMEQVYSPSSGDISNWDNEYSGGDNDKYINEWCDVIKEENTYTTIDGNNIKVPTSYDSVYQDGDTIYMGPDAYAPQGWTQLGKN